MPLRKPSSETLSDFSFSLSMKNAPPLGVVALDQDDLGIVHEGYVGYADREPGRGLVDDLHRRGLARVCGAEEVLYGRGGHAEGGRAAEDAPPRHHDLETTAAAAGAEHLLGGVDDHVAYLAGEVVLAPLHLAVDHHRGDEPDARLYDDHVALPFGVALEPLGEELEPDLVVDEYRQAQAREPGEGLGRFSRPSPTRGSAANRWKRPWSCP